MQVNDVIALRMLPALLGVPDGEVVPVFDGAMAAPDLGRLKPACESLRTTVNLFEPLAASRPESRVRAASEIEALQGSLSRVAARCVDLAVTGDPEVLKGNQELSAAFNSAGEQEADLIDRLHKGARCPTRLRPTVKNCEVK